MTAARCAEAPTPKGAGVPPVLAAYTIRGRLRWWGHSAALDRVDSRWLDELVTL